MEEMLVLWQRVRRRQRSEASCSRAHAGRANNGGGDPGRSAVVVVVVVVVIVVSGAAGASAASAAAWRPRDDASAAAAVLAGGSSSSRKRRSWRWGGVGREKPTLAVEPLRQLQVGGYTRHGHRLQVMTYVP